MKYCPQCKTEKELTLFYKHKSTSDGLTVYCRVCSKNQSRAYQEKNKEKNKEKIKEKGKKYYLKNKKTIRVKQQEFNKTPKGKSAKRQYRLKRRYKLSPDDYYNMLKQQDNKCAICRIDQSECAKQLAVDHNHTTGKIRGLLCDRCNRGIGILHDEPLLLRRAARYLEKYDFAGVPQLPMLESVSQHALLDPISLAFHPTSC